MSSAWSKRESYLMVDHRVGPGIPEGYFEKRGWDQPSIPGGALFEGAVLVCLHCQRHVIKNPKRQRERAYCPSCNGFVCDGCDAQRRAPDYVHRPFAKLVDDTLERGSRSELQLPPLLKGE